jgi:PTH1 family peptidyl-tRNA hydrolase
VVALIVGLGNPGPDYAATRHNIGHMVVAELARRAGTTLSSSRKTHAQSATVRLGGVGGDPAVIAVPMSYMNLSGGPVAALAKYHSVDPSDVVVIHDDVDLPFAAVKLKRGGGSGGHNGLKDITKALGTPDYVRVRCGVDRPPGQMDTAAYVLKPFSSTERKELPFFVDTAADAVEAVLAEGLEAAQQRFHTAK